VGGESHEANFFRFLAASKWQCRIGQRERLFGLLSKTTSSSNLALKQPWKIPSTETQHGQKQQPRPVPAFLIKQH
jgi:hypothetical protein